MKRLLLLAAPLLLLSACAPALQTVQRESASLKRDGAAVLFINPADSEAQDVAVLLSGVSGALPDVCKRRISGYVGCSLGTVPANQKYRLTFEQPPQKATASFYRAASGARPIYLELP